MVLRQHTAVQAKYTVIPHTHITIVHGSHGTRQGVLGLVVIPQKSPRKYVDEECYGTYNTQRIQGAPLYIARYDNAFLLPTAIGRVTRHLRLLIPTHWGDLPIPTLTPAATATEGAHMSTVSITSMRPQ